MKASALVLLCIVAASQGRSTGSNGAKWSAAEAGTAPWFVHLRVAVATSGFLETCAASIINQRWLLTSASCVSEARFIWSRYGALDVIRPELVLETSSVATNVILHPNYNPGSGDNDIALVSLNRDVEYTSSIAAPILASEGAEVPSSGSFCAFGQNEHNGPGEEFRCIDVELEVHDDHIHASSEDGEASRFDVGAPLVVGGVQYGILVDPHTGRFLSPAAYREWIESTAGISLPEVETSEEDTDDEDSVDEDSADEESVDEDSADEESVDEDSADEESVDEDSADEDDEAVDAVKFVN